jgi:hypothetical protein
MVAFSRDQRLARMREIGVLYDKEDEELLLEYTWMLTARGYVITRGKYEDQPMQLRMHRLLMGAAPEGMYIDHINRNPLDNRRSNLRFADGSVSNVNRAFFTDETDTRNIQEQHNGFCVKIAREDVIHYVGRYPTLDLARAARDAWKKGYDARQHAYRNDCLSEGDTNDVDMGQASSRQDSPS